MWVLNTEGAQSEETLQLTPDQSYSQGCRSDVRIGGGTQKWYFFIAHMQLIPCHHKTQLRRDSPNHSKSMETACITSYLTVILVNHNFKGLRHVMSTHVLIFRLPPTLPDPQFFSPSSFSPSVWDYFMHDSLIKMNFKIWSPDQVV